MAVIVGVLKDDHLVGGHLAWENLRINFRTRDPKSPLCVEVHLDRFGQVRVLRKEIHLKPLAQVEPRQWLSLKWLGLGNRLTLFCRLSRFDLFPIVGRYQLVAPLGGLVQLEDFLLFLLDERVKHRHFLEIVPLFMPAKAPQIGLVLRARPVKK